MVLPSQLGQFLEDFPQALPSPFEFDSSRWSYYCRTKAQTNDCFRENGATVPLLSTATILPSNGFEGHQDVLEDRVLNRVGLGAGFIGALISVF